MTPQVDSWRDFRVPERTNRPEAYSDEQANGPLPRHCGASLRRYQKRLRSDQALDFDDLIMQTIVFERIPKQRLFISVNSGIFTLMSIGIRTKPNIASCICWRKGITICAWSGMPIRVFTVGTALICKTFWTLKGLPKAQVILLGAELSLNQRPS